MSTKLHLITKGSQVPIKLFASIKVVKSFDYSILTIQMHAVHVQWLISGLEHCEVKHAAIPKGQKTIKTQP